MISQACTSKISLRPLSGRHFFHLDDVAVNVGAAAYYDGERAGSIDEPYHHSASATEKQSASKANEK